MAVECGSLKTSVSSYTGFLRLSQGTAQGQILIQELGVGNGSLPFHQLPGVVGAASLQTTPEHGAW